MNAKANATAVLDLKSAALTLIAVVLKSSDPALVAEELDRRFVEGPNPFDHDPVIIDIAALRESGEPLDLSAVVELLAKHRMRAVAVRGGSEEQQAAARALGLAEAPEELPMPPRPEAKATSGSGAVGGAGGGSPAAEPAAGAASGAAPTSGAASEAAPGEGTPAADAAARAAIDPPVLMQVVGASTLLLDKPLRSGQQVYARGGDLVVLAAVNFGAEVIADGSIHVYGPLRGRAIAGARGHTEARIFSTVMEPQLISIAGIYRTTENPLAPEVVGKPAQVRLEGEKLVVEPLRS